LKNTVLVHVISYCISSSFQLAVTFGIVKQALLVICVCKYWWLVCMACSL